ncbi:MAG: DUF1840 family protein [Thiogranum sp.]
MLVTFTTSAYAGITPFGDVALHLLKLMQNRGQRTIFPNIPLIP